MATPQQESPKTKPDLREIEKQKFDQAIGQEPDPVMLILRAHLFSESLLERFILLRLPRGDRLIEHASLTYAQKLQLVAALDDIGDPIISSLRNLNKLRNQCAHELGRTISGADVIRIGSPLGEFFTTTHRTAAYEPVQTLRAVVSYVCGYVTGVCHGLEEAKDKAPARKAEAASTETVEEVKALPPPANSAAGTGTSEA